MIEVLDLDADPALFSGKLNGLVATIHRNERPLAGLGGLLDWRLRGALSQAVRAGAIDGSAGECAYFPFRRHGRTFHLFLVGAGESRSPGARATPPPESWRALQKNLTALRLEGVGLSRADFGGATPELIAKNLKGAPLWITR